MGNIDEKEKSDHDLISLETLEEIRDGGQTHPTVDKREARCKIRDRIKQTQSEWKGALKATRNMGTIHSVSYLRVLFCPCVVRKSMAHVETKMLNMHHQAQKGFRGIFVGIPQHQKGYIVYVPSTRKVIFSYDVLFDKNFSSALSYTSRHPSVSLNITIFPSEGFSGF